MKTDVVIGAEFGDEGKSKITAALAAAGEYTHTMRYNGGENCGHTFYIKGQKYITHMIPTGAFYGIESIIGSGCVINEHNFFSELDGHAKMVPDIAKHVKIAYNAHVVTNRHIEEESAEAKIGTTRKGIGPAYRDKHARVGLRAEDIASFKPYLVDIYEELYIKNPDAVLLCEGAQALGLDINFGDYPYVTSSSCGVGEVINNGIAPAFIRDIIAVAKVYTTYVGNKQFQDPNDPVLDRIADVGHEVGATTGRRRQVNYVDLDMLLKSQRICSATKIILNKLDILREVGVWKIIQAGKVIDLQTEDAFKTTISDLFSGLEVIFSESPYTI